MSKLIRNGCIVSALAAFIIGCGAAAEDRLAKEEVATIEKLAGLFEKVTDKSSMDTVQPEIGVLSARLGKINEELDALGIDKKKAAKDKVAPQMEAAMTRMKTAKIQAAKAAFGVGS